VLGTVSSQQAVEHALTYGLLVWAKLLLDLGLKATGDGGIAELVEHATLLERLDQFTDRLSLQLLRLLLYVFLIGQFFSGRYRNEWGLDSLL